MTEPQFDGAGEARDDRSIGALFNDAATDLGILLSTQIDLAKLELRDEVVRAGRAAALLASGAVTGAMTLLLLTFAGAWAVGEALGSPALGFLIVGVIYAIGAAVLLIVGRRHVREVDLVPRRTVETVKSDVAWAKERLA